MTHVLAVDLGSTGIKVAVVNADGRVRGVAGEVIPLLFVGDRGVEQDPRQWWEALGRCARAAVAAAGLSGDAVRAVAVTGQYSSTTAVDVNGLPLGNTVMWMDARGPTFRRPFSGDAERWWMIHGLAPSGNDAVARIDVIKATRPDVYAAAHAFVEPMEHLVGRLTGSVAATQNTMFPMICCDNRSWGLTDYDDELVAMSGMPREKLPPLVPMGEARGLITRAAAAHLRISSLAVVTGPTIDSVTTAVGTGAVTADRCGLSIGTTSVLATHLPTKRDDQEHGLTSVPSPLPRSWLMIAENGIGGKAFDVFVNNLVFAADGLGKPAHAGSFADVVAVASRVPCGSNGVMFLPWLIGSMAPKRSRGQRGGFVNIGLSTTRADMARAVLEGVAMNAGWLLPHVSRLAGHAHQEITFGGGGAGSGLWAQIVADACGVSVRRLANPGFTNAHGAALLALVEMGECVVADVASLLTIEEVHTPDDAAHELLTRRLRSMIDYFDCSVPFYESFDAAPTPA